MKNENYVNLVNRSHLMYWDMLGKLRGIENHCSDGLRWLTGDVAYNYFTDTSDTDGVISRMRNNEIPKNLTFPAVEKPCQQTEAFMATGLFTSETVTGMAHKLDDVLLPKPDKRLNVFRVNEISQLKAAGAILNSAFEYKLFSFEHYIDMMKNDGQYFYLAEYDGLPVGACMSIHGDDFIGISWVGTLPGYRKLGIAGYLIQEAEYEGIKHGKTIGVLGAYPGAVGAYKRVGYREYCYTIILELRDSEE